MSSVEDNLYYCTFIHKNISMDEVNYIITAQGDRWAWRYVTPWSDTKKAIFLHKYDRDHIWLLFEEK